MAFYCPICKKSHEEVATVICPDGLGKLKLQRDELLKAADALLGKMGGPDSPIQPVYEDEFIALELLVDRLKGQDVDSIERRRTSKRICKKCKTSSHDYCSEGRCECHCRIKPSEQPD